MVGRQLSGMTGEGSGLEAQWRGTSHFGDLDAATTGIPGEACYTEPIMSRFVNKYRAILLVAFQVTRIRLLLRLLSLPRVLDRVHPRSVVPLSDETLIEDFIYYLERWLQLFPYNKKGNCFPRSLALYGFARRLGHPVLFHCGVRKEGGLLDGHAWLTLNGHAFYEPGQHWQRFTMTFSYPPDPSVGGSQGAAPPAFYNQTASPDATVI